MRRELQEIGPIEPLPGKEWWEHLTKRFLHEEFFSRANVSANRDFLLSLHPSLVYHEPALDRVRQARTGAVEVAPQPASRGREIADHVRSEEALAALSRWATFTDAS
jgi:hypothetical protein